MVLRTTDMAFRQLMPFLKPNCRLDEERLAMKGRAQCSKILEAITLRVMLLKSSLLTFLLFPLNLGIGVTIPKPKWREASPIDRKMLKIAVRINCTQ